MRVLKLAWLQLEAAPGPRMPSLAAPDSETINRRTLVRRARWRVDSEAGGARGMLELASELPTGPGCAWECSVWAGGVVRHRIGFRVHRLHIRRPR